jgi:ABC-type multidrug transport system ATPase subunit
MFDNLKPHFTTYTSSLKLIKPYITTTHILAIITSGALPIIDCALSYYNKSSTDGEDESKSNEMFSANLLLAFIPPVIACTKVALDMYLVNSIAKSLKEDNINKLLDANKFLLNTGHTDSSRSMKSLNNHTVGYNIDDTVDTAVKIAMGIPIGTISIACGLGNTYILTNSIIPVGSAFGLGVGSIVASNYLGSKTKYYNDKNLNMLNEFELKLGFIENNRSSVVMLNALEHEKKAILNELNDRSSELPNIVGLSFAKSLIAYCALPVSNIFCAPFVSDFTASQVSYLNLTVGMVAQNISNLSRIISNDVSVFKNHLERLKIFNKAHQEWQDLLKENNNLAQEFVLKSNGSNGDNIITLKDFSIQRPSNIKLTASKDLINQEEASNMKKLQDEISDDSGLWQEAQLTRELLNQKYKEDWPIEITARYTELFVPKEHWPAQVAQYIKDKSFILHDVNLSLKANNVYHLVGQSGCGKTTVLKALVNNWPYTSGKVSYNCAKEDIYFLPQQPCIPPNSTLRDIIAYPVTDYQGNIFNTSHIKELMTTFGLAEKAEELDAVGKNWANDLSGGEKQKIALIGAIIKHPKLLILDEATSAIDEVSRNNLHTTIRDELPETTIIFTDHNHNSLEHFRDHQLKINAQQLEICGALGHVAQIDLE